MQKILAIDDKQDNLITLSAMLKNLMPGCVVITAQSGMEGIQKAGAELPDAILLDIKMPDMDGFETCRRLMDDERTKRIPVIMITAIKTDPASRIEGLDCGAIAFLFKPIDQYELVSQVKVAFRIKNAEDALREERNFLERMVAQRTASLQEEITERKRAEEALRESQALLNEMGKMAKVGGWELDTDTLELRWTEETYRIHELSPESKPPLEEAINYFHPEEREKLSDSIQHALKYGEAYDMELRFITAKGKHLWTRTICIPQLVDGKTVRLKGSFQDITERKQAEEALKKSEEQYRQAQKMESIGQLAGGVAHDFNNMLNIILGYSQLALIKIEPSSPLNTDLQEIMNATRRSADLVRQLLAFARKQIIAPKVLDLNDTVGGMLNMLRRLIGEDIDLLWSPVANIWPVKMDPTQVNQLLANLAVNARDSISGVGKITIETGETEFDEAYCTQHAGFVPGQYVLLAVSDDGCGMDKETCEQIFEPFFTTKEFGKGTGMGLATVYGIVKQNNGFINVYSEPGNGTTFKIYLPRHGGGEAEEVIDEPHEQAEPLTGTETVLLVEDNEVLLNMSKIMLEELGYTVLAASSPNGAIQLAEQYAGDIHLLLTDVIMPEMSGRDLQKRLSAIRLGIKCLFISGYTANVIAHRGILDEGVNFLQKPFHMEGLATKVREALDTP